LAKLKILFVGESWNGSSARSMRDSLSSLDMVELDDIGEDLYQPKGRSIVIRGINRLLKYWYQRELAKEIKIRLISNKPDVLIVYKGNLITSETVIDVKKLNILTVNIFPDYSPHAYGLQLKKAIGVYDLVISTKPFHMKNWLKTYGYKNECVFVPHGYDTKVHLWTDPPKIQNIDIIMAASWRDQYEKFLVKLANNLGNLNFSVSIAGSGWSKVSSKFPKHWKFPGPLYGRAYGEFIRSGKVVIAPVHSEVRIRGQIQPGDEDTTRTYELASAGCFFLHQRTTYVSNVYDEQNEVPLWSDGDELGRLIQKYLPLESRRREMALAAHQRAVPSYSVEARSLEALEYIQKHLIMLQKQ
jgi:glycosyltransferase involved in cell wall biosynthesis